MEDKRLDDTQETAIVLTTEATTAIPEQTARLVEKSIADNTMRNRKQALRAFSYWLRGREITDRHLAEYRQSTGDNQHCGRRDKVFFQAPQLTIATLAGIRREDKDRVHGQRNGLTWL